MQQYVAVCVLQILLVKSIHTFQSDLSLTYMNLNGTTCIKCPPGTFLLEDCDQENTIAKCQLCPNNTFSPVPNRATICHQCSKACDLSSMEIVSECTLTNDIICQCPYGYYNRRRRNNVQRSDCVKHTVCASGFGVVKTGTSESDTVCESCRPRCTYSNVPSSIQPCKACSNCGEFKIKDECDTTTDRVCSNERKGPSEYVFNNDTVIIIQEPMTDIPLVLGLSITYAVTVFILLLIIGKLCCRARSYYLDGINGPMDYYYPDPGSMRSYRSSQMFRTPAPTEAGSRTTSLLTIGVPTAASELGYYSNRSTSTLEIQFPVYEENRGWDTQYDIVLNHLAGQITTGWRSVITDLLLGISVPPDETEDIIDELDNYHCSMKEKLFEGLLRWKEKGGDKANPNSLLSSLYSQELHGVILDLRKKYPDIFCDESDNEDRETDV